ncbi:MAG: hypothetical protein ACFFAT_21085 [Promethearchaeota archaeon]
MYWIQLKESNLYEFQRNLNWKGKGTKDNPLIIDNLKGLKHCLRFKKIKSHIFGRNLELCELCVRSCQNISFENYQVCYFWIEFCNNIRIENSSIINLDIDFSKGNVFRNNKLDKYSHFTISSIEEKGEKGGNINFYISIPPIIVFLAMGIGTAITYGIMLGFSIFLFVVILLYFVFIINSFKKKIRVKKYASNIFENNNLTELDELDKK